MTKSAVLFAVAISVLPLSAQESKPDFIVSPLNVELGMRSILYSPMLNPSFGINMEFGLNPGWFIDHGLCVGVFFAYAHYFGATHASAFLSDAGSAYTPIDYISPIPATTIDKMLGGALDDLSDHRWGLTLRLPVRYSPFLKLYWLNRAVTVSSGSTGSYSSGGVTYVTGYGATSYGYLGQGAGAELAMPLGVFEWGKWNLLEFSRISVFAQYINVEGATFHDPRPLFGEMFNSGFNGKYGDIVEFGLSISLGF